MSRLAIVCCTVGISAALSSTAFAQDAAPPPAAGTMTSTTTTMPAAGATGTAGATTTTGPNGAPTLVVVEPPPDTRPKQGLEKPPADEPIMFRSGLFGVLGAVSDSPTVLPAMTVADHAFVGVGLQFAWNDNTSANGGLASAANPPCAAPVGNAPSANCPGGAHKFNSNLVVAGEYMFIDKLPFAIGPELTILGSLAPDRVFTTLVFEPGIAFWYAPFRAPLVLGSALDAEIITQNGLGAATAKAQVTILTPGLRLGYIFN